MISCELNLLLSKCRAAPGSHAAAGTMAAREAQHGPLDFALWAYRDA